MYRAKRGLVFERLCEHQQKLLERCEVFTLNRRLDHRLDTMIARYEGRIDRSHPGATISASSGSRMHAASATAQPMPQTLAHQ